MTKVFINGEFLNQEDAKVSYEDRGYVFGDGIYEYIRAYNGKLFTVTEHFERFLRSASEIQIDLGYTVEELTDIVNGGIYIQATRGVAPRNHSFPTPEVKPVIMAFAKSYDRPYDDFENGINTVTVEDIRWLRCDIKSLNLLGNVLAKEYAVKYNATEAIQHREETVTEGASSNVYAIKDGEIYTHPVNNYILNGITRKVIKWVAEDYNIPFNEETFTVDFLKNADEVIVSSTSAEVTPVVKIDGEIVNDGKVGPITKKLQEGFEKYIESKSIN